jgi:FtsZ-binding cell division protein ZapB
MDFLHIDLVKKKLSLLFARIESLKSENHDLKRKMSSLSQGRSSDHTDLKAKYSNLVKERDRLMMERELIRGKVKVMVDRIDALEGKGD